VAVKIFEDCISCGACEPVCPNEAISPGDEIYVVDPNKCTECYGWYEFQQCISVCPVDCIHADPDHRESVEELAAKHKRQHPEHELENTDKWQPPA